MKYTLPLKKTEATALLGGTVKLAAEALGYQSLQGFYKLPEVLSHRDSLAVLGAVFLRQLERQQRPTITCTWGKGLSALVRGGRAA